MRLRRCKPSKCIGQLGVGVAMLIFRYVSYSNAEVRWEFEGEKKRDIAPSFLCSEGSRVEGVVSE